MDDGKDLFKNKGTLVHDTDPQAHSYNDRQQRDRPGRPGRPGRPYIPPGDRGRREISATLYSLRNDDVADVYYAYQHHLLGYPKIAGCIALIVS